MSSPQTRSSTRFPLGATDAYVVQLAAMGQCHHARGVDLVVAHLGGRRQGLAVEDRGRPVQGPLCLHGRKSPGLVGSLLVIDRDEAVELGLEGREDLGGWPAAQVGLQRSVVALDLSLGLAQIAD